MKIISWNTTNQCNLSCPHCYRDAGVDMGQELNTKEAKKMLTEIKAAGFQLMIFSGGEPLLRNDIYELIAYAAKIGLRPVLGTGGSLLNKKRIKKLKTAGLLAAGISLDSIDPKKHDQFRGQKGLFAKIEAAFEELKKADIPFQTHMTVMDWNLGEIEEMIDYSAAVGAKAAHIFFMVPTGRAAYIKENAVSKKDYQQAVERIMKKSEEVEIEVKPVCAPQFIAVADQLGIKSRFKNGCLAGINYAIVNPIGEVQPCAYLDLQLGSVREKSFKNIWENNDILKEMRTMDWQGKCGSCQYSQSCKGCRARAYYSSGDYMGADPFCSVNNNMEAIDKKILNQMQKGLKLEASPYQNLAAKLGIEAEELIRRLKNLKKAGFIRRIGGVFRSSALGYQSTLIALELKEEYFYQTADFINQHPGVTHNYRRNNRLNLWFTLSAASEAKKEEFLNKIKVMPGVKKLYQLPKEKLFKLDVFFDLADKKS